MIRDRWRAVMIRLRPPSWKGWVWLAVAVLVMAVLVADVVRQVWRAIEDPSRIPGLLLVAATATVVSWLLSRLYGSTEQARGLEKRVAALERFRDMATAAGAEQQDQLEALQRQVSRTELARADFERGLIDDPRQARR